MMEIHALLCTCVVDVAIRGCVEIHKKGSVSLTSVEDDILFTINCLEQILEEMVEWRTNIYKQTFLIEKSLR